MNGWDLARLIPGEALVDLPEQQVRAFETVILILQVTQRSQKQAGPNQQHQRKHHLYGHKRLGPETG